MSAPYDQGLANQAAAADQCMIWAVILRPSQVKTGFGDRPPHDSQPKSAE